MKTTDRRVFDTAFQLWSARSSIFATRERLKRYTYGDQWGDITRDRSGCLLPEHQLLINSGRNPITNNLIRRLVKTIIGRYRDMADRNKWYDKTDQSTDSLCELDELDSRLLEEFLISGMAIQRVADDDPLSDLPLQVRNVSPGAFFCNDFRDPRGNDLEIVGMLHDMSPAEVTLRFGKRSTDSNVHPDSLFGAPDLASFNVDASSDSFFVARAGRLRVIEVWTRQFDKTGRTSWVVRWFAPSGLLLDSYSAPWRHRSHPFVIKFYPLTDGEVHSFVEDVVDQQRYINRLIVLMDRILATSAKGVLLFPLSQKTKDFSWKEIASRWSSTDGIIPITGNGDAFPQQITSAGGDNSAYRLLEMELRLFDQTAGVGSALLASSAPNANLGVEHYRAQVENATVALADIFNTFRSLIRHRNLKIKSL